MIEQITSHPSLLPVPDELVPYFGRATFVLATEDELISARNKVDSIISDMDKSQSTLLTLSEAKATWKLLRADMVTIRQNLTEINGKTGWFP